MHAASVRTSDRQHAAQRLSLDNGRVLTRREEITIRYGTVYLCALKSRRDGQHSLAHGTETKNKEN